MPTLPEGTKYGTLTWQVIRAVGDTAQDPDRDPDATTIDGIRAVFTPTVGVMKDATVPVTVFANPITASFDEQGYMIGEDGQRGIRLIATDSPNLEPQGVQYKVVLSAPSIASQTLTVEVWADQTTDLTNAVIPSAGNRTRFATVIPSADHTLLPASTQEGDLILAQDSSQLYQLTDATLIPIANLRGVKGDTGDITPEAAQALADAHAAASDAGDARDVAVQARDTALAAVGQMLPVWDESAGEYELSSVATFMRVRRDGQVYGVSVPKGMATACTKTGANAGIPAPTPGVIGTPAVDQYRDRGAFRFLEVNAFVDPDGTGHVTGISGDGRFKRDGSNGDVWILAPVLWWKADTSGSDAVAFSVSDSPAAGLSPQPKAYLPDGSLRPFMLYAKYALSIDSGTARSVSGAAVAIRTVSHNNLITTCKTATTAYSAKSVADDWYMKIMFLLKYATKHSQSVFAGCSSHDVQANPTLAETGVTRVVVATAKAAQIPVGSAMMLGSATTTDRQASGAYDVFDALRVTSKVAIDASNTAINFDTQVPFTTATSQILMSAPWRTGSCDLVEGDGSPSSPTSGREPFVLQGIEMALGMAEILGDVILSTDGTTGWQPFVVADSRQAATSVTAAYAATGKSLPTDTNDSWKYPLCPDSALGLLFGTGVGASQTTGICDGTYTNKLSTTGTREWRSLGNLTVGGSAGVFFVSGSSGLGSTWWSIGSRLSATGRSRG